jgi:predicted phosphodiesterase
MNYILLADLHLTNNSLDEYRWEWLDRFTKWFSKFKPSEEVTIVILGDITESKDRHSSMLVNRFITMLGTWLEINRETHIVIVSGNHDGLDSSKPYFRFLNNIKQIRMITKPTTIAYQDYCLFLPHTKTPIEDWYKYDMTEFDYIFMHQPINRAKTSNDFEIKDSVLSSDYFDNVHGNVFSGDIHVPQRLGKVRYVGSPYPIYFGDSFSGRFIVIDNKIRGVHLNTIRKIKLKISSIKELYGTMSRFDQLNIEYILDRTEQHRWVKHRDKIRAYVKEMGATIVHLELIVPNMILVNSKRKRLRGPLTDEEYIRQYSKKNKLDKLCVDTGIEIIKEVKEQYD